MRRTNYFTISHSIIWDTDVDERKVRVGWVGQVDGLRYGRYVNVGSTKSERQNRYENGNKRIQNELVHRWTLFLILMIFTPLLKESWPHLLKSDLITLLIDSYFNAFKELGTNHHEGINLIFVFYTICTCFWEKLSIYFKE